MEAWSVVFAWLCTFSIFNCTFFSTHKYFLLWITMKRYSQLSLSCILPWMHDFGVLVKPKWNSMNIKWAPMALYETGSERYGPGVARNNPFHNQSLKTSVSLKQKGCSLSKYGPSPADKWQTRQTWIIKQNDFINLLTLPRGEKHQEADIVFPVI